MDKELFRSFVELGEADEKFIDYIDSKCIEAVTESEEYIKKEHSGNYSEQELSVMRERLVFMKAWSLTLTNKK